MKKIIWFLVVISTALVVCAACAAIDDPVKQAEANKINIQANTEADMAVRRQQAVLENDRTLAQAEAQAVLMDAQTRAQTAGLVIAAVVVIILSLAGCVTVIVVACTRTWENEHPKILHRSTYYIRANDGQRILTTQDETALEIYNRQHSTEVTK